MKKAFLAIGAALALAGCASKDAQPKSLIVYYSQTGATQQVAELIQAQTGADILRIEAALPYDGDFGQTIARCQEEMASGVLPELQAMDKNVADYDIIYLGFPVWFGTYAPPVKTFLEEVDLSGKEVVPFCTFGSGGLETSVRNLAQDEPEAILLEGFGIRNARIAHAAEEVEQWLIRLGAIEGEPAPLPEYGEQAELTDETAAIFEEATAGYPMPLGKAVSVAAAEDGVHYCFAAEGMGPDGSVASTMVYVVRPEGEKAEFTRVQR